MKSKTYILLVFIPLICSTKAVNNIMAFGQSLSCTSLHFCPLVVEGYTSSQSAAPQKQANMVPKTDPPRSSNSNGGLDEASQPKRPSTTGQAEDNSPAKQQKVASPSPHTSANNLDSQVSPSSKCACNVDKILDDSNQNQIPLCTVESFTISAIKALELTENLKWIRMTSVGPSQYYNVYFAVMLHVCPCTWGYIPACKTQVYDGGQGEWFLQGCKILLSFTRTSTVIISAKVYFFWKPCTGSFEPD